MALRLVSYNLKCEIFSLIVENWLTDYNFYSLFQRRGIRASLLYIYSRLCLRSRSIRTVSQSLINYIQAMEQEQFRVFRNSFLKQLARKQGDPFEKHLSRMTNLDKVSLPNLPKARSISVNQPASVSTPKNIKEGAKLRLKIAAGKLLGSGKKVQAENLLEFVGALAVTDNAYRQHFKIVEQQLRLNWVVPRIEEADDFGPALMTAREVAECMRRIMTCKQKEMQQTAQTLRGAVKAAEQKSARRDEVIKSMKGQIQYYQSRDNCTPFEVTIRDLEERLKRERRERAAFIKEKEGLQEHILLLKSEISEQFKEEEKLRKRIVELQRELKKVRAKSLSEKQVQLRRMIQLCKDIVDKLFIRLRGVVQELRAVRKNNYQLQDEAERLAVRASVGHQGLTPRPRWEKFIPNFQGCSTAAMVHSLMGQTGKLQLAKARWKEWTQAKRVAKESYVTEDGGQGEMESQLDRLQELLKGLAITNIQD